MNKKLYITAIILTLATILTFSSKGFGQRPPRDENRQPEWITEVDTNKNGIIEQEEFRAAAELFFKQQDANGNGILEANELPGKPDENRAPEPPRGIPPFLFLERGEFNLTREQFDEKANLRFSVLDANGDLRIDGAEMREMRPPDRDRSDRENGDRFPEKTPFQKTAQFVGAEMRFGDKVVKNAPFSAETVREESKRLFDGSIVKNTSKGLIYRDGEGRIRQEQPFERIGSFTVTGADNQPIKLIQIIDFTAGNSYSLNTSAKTYFKVPYLQNLPFTPKDKSPEGKTESLGKQTIEGIAAEGTRTTIEIRAGEIGNDKPIYVVTEKWFAPELQTVILSKHTDPFIGEVTFRLVNLKLGEPAPALFKIPNDYTLTDIEKNRRRDIDAPRDRRPN